METKVISFFCFHCGEKINVDSKSAGKTGKCPKCAAMLTVPAPSKNASQRRPSELSAPDRELAQSLRCDSCGMVLSSISTKCPACGNELYRKKGSSYLDGLRRQLAAVDAELIGLSANELFRAKVDGMHAARKAAIIETFTVPNNKDVILELLSLSTSNGDGSSSDIVVAAWRAKAKQMLGKAQVFAARDADYLRIVAPFELRMNSWPARDKMEWVKALGVIAVILLMLWVFRLIFH